MYIDKDGGAQCIADNEDDEREILPYPGTKWKLGDMEILRILQISSRLQTYANKGISTLRSVVLG